MHSNTNAQSGYDQFWGTFQDADHAPSASSLAFDQWQQPQSPLISCNAPTATVEETHHPHNRGSPTSLLLSDPFPTLVSGGRLFPLLTGPLLWDLHLYASAGMMDGQKPLVEQTCHPPGEAHGVNITVSPDGSVGVQGSAYSHPLAGAHDMSLQKLLTGRAPFSPLARQWQNNGKISNMSLQKLLTGRVTSKPLAMSRGIVMAILAISASRNCSQLRPLLGLRQKGATAGICIQCLQTVEAANRS